MHEECVKCDDRVLFLRVEGGSWVHGIPSVIIFNNFYSQSAVDEPFTDLAVQQRIRQR